MTRLFKPLLRINIFFGGLLALLALEGCASVLFEGSFFGVAALVCRLKVVDAVVSAVHEADDMVCGVSAWLAA